MRSPHELGGRWLFYFGIHNSLSIFTIVEVIMESKSKKMVMISRPCNRPRFEKPDKKCPTCKGDLIKIKQKYFKDDYAYGCHHCSIAYVDSRFFR